MSSASSLPPPPTYHTLLNTLLSPSLPIPLASLPHSPIRLRFPALQSQIPILQIHPLLESALHLLNLDLPAAHFLLRHMQDPSKHPEAALLHGILHRIEGDLDNARAWYASTADAVGKEGGEENVLTVAWPGATSVGNGTGNKAALERGTRFLDDAGRVRDVSSGNGESGEKAAKLARMGEEEIVRVVKWCERKYGTGRVEDATKVWTAMAQEHRKQAGDMIVGGEGWRVF